MKKALPLLALLAVLAGCDSSTPKKETPSVGGTSSGATPDATPENAALASYIEKLPAELKNDAFEYYGLGNTKPTKLEIVREGIPTPATRTVEPGKVENGKATFVLRHEGALEINGDITLSLESDGLYAMASSNRTIKAHSLEMPAKLEVGGGWKDHTEMTQSGQKMVLDNDLKIAAKERISTPGGTFDEALHVTSTGKGTVGGKAVTLTTESWYVRGLGPVKQNISLSYVGGKKDVVTIQLAAPDKPAETGGDTKP
ncbi:hypothetical protein EON82_20755 [bacterium]|nr:MAG: hypothetical protein EON82_20755 [bacterium]